MAWARKVRQSASSMPPPSIPTTHCGFWQHPPNKQFPMLCHPQSPHLPNHLILTSGNQSELVTTVEPAICTFVNVNPNWDCIIHENAPWFYSLLPILGRPQKPLQHRSWRTLSSACNRTLIAHMIMVCPPSGVPGQSTNSTGRCFRSSFSKALWSEFFFGILWWCLYFYAFWSENLCM